MSTIADAGDTQAYIAKTIGAHAVVLFMKGTPSRPQCGFSAAVVDVRSNPPRAGTDRALRPRV